MDPEVARVLPPARAVAGVGEPLLQLADLAAVFVLRGARVRVTGDVLPLAFIRPAGEGHWVTAIKQFAVRRGERAPKAAGVHLAEISNALGLEVYLPDVRSGGLGQAGKDCGVSNRRQAVKSPSADQLDGFARAGAPKDGSVWCAGVGGAQFERMGAEVFAASEPDSEAALGGIAVPPESAGRVAGALQCGEGPGERAGIGVAALRGDEELRSTAWIGGKERSAEDRPKDQSGVHPHTDGMLKPLLEQVELARQNPGCGIHA